ncbi:MAG: IS21 family transposase [Clostridiaceae bacterium]|nr:IS21 family transposase [Clostridiaceae bacterium]
MSSNYVEVLRTALSGVSGRQTSKQHRVSRDTVSILLRYARNQGWKDVKDLEHVTEDDLRVLFSGSSGKQGRRDSSYTFPDYEYVHQELGKAHVTLTMLWEEYVETCILENKRYYRETQFRRYYHQFAKSKKCTIRLEHKPGLAVQVDWAGTRICYYDEEIGEFQESSLFVAVLPCSNLIYAEVFRDEKLSSWISGHVNCFRYFGGVPKTVVPDNLKTGVTKANFYEPTIQQSYQEMADFYGTVILPAHIRKPKDKGAVENSVKIVSQKILGKLRNYQIHNFFELQETVADALELINSTPLTGKNMSRWDAFLQEEKDYLLMLPAETFELSEWKQAKVQPNCHVVYQGHFYSVSFEHIGETVDIRATHRTVEIFYHHQRITSHKILWGKDQYSTVEEHMPPGKLFFLTGIVITLFVGQVRLAQRARKSLPVS